MSRNAPPATLIVTGLSGAGKSTALAALADAGYYCVDNLPPTLATSTIVTCRDAGIVRVALGMDVRVGAFHDALDDAVAALRDEGELGVLYLLAADEAIVRRFHETRRPHPMLAAASAKPPFKALSLLDGVRLERQRLASIRSEATAVVDTTHLTVHQLRRTLLDRFGAGGGVPMQVRVVSFGFKHGVPLDANLVFDVRFLDNPHFVPKLREQTGIDAPVAEFVLASPGASELLERLESLLELCLPRYQQEGKSYLTIAIGCTGGRHRSVALAIELGHRLARGTDLRVGIVHRDVSRGAIMTTVSIPDDAHATHGGVATALGPFAPETQGHMRPEAPDEPSFEGQIDAPGQDEPGSGSAEGN